MNKPSIYIVVVEKSHIDSGDILPVVKTIHALAERGAYKSMALSFSGYDNTAVELWEMPEIRKWCNKLINKVPFLFYYLEQDAYQTRTTIMLCLNDYEAVLAGDKKSPEEYAAEGKFYEELPQYMMKIHLHQKSFRLMSAEIRKHARKLGTLSKAESLIKEMNEMYGVSAD